MQLKSYLAGLSYSPFEGINDIVVVPRSGNSGWYYISTYSVFQANSNQLSKLYKDLGHNIQFQFHHIVEKRYLRKFFDSSAEIDRLYNHVWPCVLIDKHVHEPFSWMFATNAPAEVFDVNSGKPLATEERKDELRKVINMYTSYYSGNIIFQKIALNVLHELYQ